MKEEIAQLALIEVGGSFGYIIGVSKVEMTDYSVSKRMVRSNISII